MAIAIYGGSFNPPHLGHMNAAKAVQSRFEPEQLFVIPAGLPPHKEVEVDSFASGEHRIAMCRIAFGDGVQVCDMELKREGKSYTVDTLKAFRERYPGEELILTVGTDMFLSLDSWHEADRIFELAHICAVRRDDMLDALTAKAEEYRVRFGARCTLLGTEPLPAASSQLRSDLKARRGRELLSDGVYEYIIRHRLYGAKPDFQWLRERAYAMLKPKRIPHVRGCEEEAVRLARRWGADVELAAEAAILHDITKKLMLPEQLILCGKYDIISDALEAGSEKLLHSKTGAALAKDLFGCCGEVEEAIRWHTTGRAGMSLLEKIIYMADYIEPGRDFDGVDTLRSLAYEDLDKAMLLGLEMSRDEISGWGYPVHENSIKAMEWFRSITG